VLYVRMIDCGVAYARFGLLPKTSIPCASTAGFPHDPERSGQADGRIRAADQAYHHRQGKLLDAVDIEEKRKDISDADGSEGGQAGIDRASQGLVDRQIDQFGQRHFTLVKTLIFPDPVVDNNGVVDREAEDRQDDSHQRFIQWDAQDDEHEESDKDVMEQGNQAHDTG